MVHIRHYGLYFTLEHVQTAQKEREREPFAAAWQYLRGHEQVGAGAALWAALRYRFAGQESSVETAVELLNRHSDPELMEDLPPTEAAGETLMLAQTFEILRDHPAFHAGDQARWRDAFTERVGKLNAMVISEVTHERYWVMALNLAAGIVLEREPIIDQAAAGFQRAVAEEIRPQGYIHKAVAGEDGGGMYRHVMACSALTLMAEMAGHIGVDLWGYAVRGVSVMTAAIYPIYYFYVTAKWKWDPGLTPEEVQLVFQRHGGYLEMIYRRNPSKDLLTILNDLRPVCDLRAGGLTTLSHAPSLRRRGLFG